MHKALICLALVALTAGAFVVHGCALTASEMSCSQKNAQTGKVERCIEYSDFSTASVVTAKASLQLLCKGFNADIDDKLCNTTTALAGCKKARDNAWTQIDWTYASDTETSASSVSCGSNDVRVGPDRQPLADQSNPDLASTADMRPPGCSPSTATPAVTITWKNNTSGTVSTYWVNPACTEVYYQTIATGGSMTQTTFVGHPWRVRQGAQDVAGTVLKDFTAQASDAPAVMVNIP